MSEHDEQADRVERELDDMRERSEHLEDEIAGAREEWERKKRDPLVPTGETPREHEDEDEEPPPEADFTSRGD